MSAVTNPNAWPHNQIHPNITYSRCGFKPNIKINEITRVNDCNLHEWEITTDEDTTYFFAVEGGAKILNTYQSLFNFFHLDYKRDKFDFLVIEPDTCLRICELVYSKANHGYLTQFTFATLSGMFLDTLFASTQNMSEVKYGGSENLQFDFDKYNVEQYAIEICKCFNLMVKNADSHSNYGSFHSISYKYNDIIRKLICKMEVSYSIKVWDTLLDSIIPKFLTELMASDGVMLPDPLRIENQFRDYMQTLKDRDDEHSKALVEWWLMYNLKK